MSDAPFSVPHVDALSAAVQSEPDLGDLLTQSLNKAKAAAQKDLEPALYKALDWPTDIPGYVDYLLKFWRWRPQQDPIPAWTKPGTNGFQEVYDRLCHFYFLVDQPVGPNGVRVQSIPAFAKFLVAYAKGWGSFLNTPDSFNDDILASFIKNSPEYAVGDSMIDGRPNAPSGWLTFNQFFARELNPGLRPIHAPADNRVAVAPADCTFKATYAINENSEIPEIKLKGTHSFASIGQLLDGGPYSDAFANGTFVHYFLGPYSYHRFHTPVAGRVVERRAIKGDVYLDVTLSEGQFDAPDTSTDGYEFSQSRGLITLDTAGSPFGDVGVVAVLPIGMAQVSSVNMTAQLGADLMKGDEFGYFLFGGSDIIILFQEKAKPHLYLDASYRHYGTPMAILSGGCPCGPACKCGGGC